MNLKKLLSASLAIVALASCQTASDPYMELETKLLTLDSDGGTATVTLTSNVYYRVNNDCSDASGEHYWARISDTETSGDKTVLHFEVRKEFVRNFCIRIHFQLCTFPVEEINESLESDIELLC